MNKSTSESDGDLFAGMTVNERLFSAGILDQFDAAARRRDRLAMLSLLRRVSLTERQAAETADTILADPSFYGLKS